MVANFGTIKQFKLPDLGESNTWPPIFRDQGGSGQKLACEGGRQGRGGTANITCKFQPVADVATDKMFTQIPSSYQGRVHKIFHELEQTCQVGELFLEIDVEDDTELVQPPKKS